MTTTGLQEGDLAPLPCPFCGGEAAMRPIRDGQQMHCTVCHSAGAPTYHGPTGWKGCADQAITAWNTRALRSPSASGVGGLVAVFQELLSAQDAVDNFDRRHNFSSAQLDALDRRRRAFNAAEQALSAYRAQETQEEGAYHVAGEAYQVIGALAHVTNTFDTPEVQRALDYFSADEQDGSILPYTPPTPAPPSIEELVRVFDAAWSDEYERSGSYVASQRAVIAAVLERVKGGK